MSSYLRWDEYQALDLDFGNILREVDKRIQSPEIKPFADALGTGLDYLGRPISTVASAVEAVRTGGDVREAMRQGLAGTSNIKGFGDVFRNAGMPEFGRLEVGPLSISGRDVLGFGADMLLDPLTYTVGILNKIDDAADALKALSKAKASSSAVDISHLQGVRQAANLADQAPVPEINITNTLRQNTQATPARALANLPGLKHVAEIISPSMVDNLSTEEAGLAKQAIIARLAQDDQIQNIANSLMAPLRQNVPFKMKGDNIQMPNGEWKPYDALFSTNDPYKFAPTPEEAARTGAATFTPEQLDFVKRVQRLGQAVSKYAADQGVQFKPAKGPEGFEYVPRKTLDKPDPFDIPVYRRALGKETASQKARGYETMQEGIEAGWEYADLLTAMEQHIKNMYTAVADEQLRKTMLPLAKREDVLGRAALEGTMSELRAESARSKELKDLLSRVTRGEKLPSQTIKRLREGGYDSQVVDLIQKASSVNPNIVLQVAVRNLGQLAREQGREVTDLIKGEIQSLHRSVQELGNLPYWEVEDYLAGSLANLGLDQKQAVELAAKSFKEAAQKSYAANKDYRDSLIKEAGGLIKDYRSALRENMAASRREISEFNKAEKARLAGTAAPTGQPALADLRFSPEVLRELAKYTKTDVNSALKGVEKVGGLSRTVMASLDMSAPMIQGLIVLSTNPKAWAKATYESFESLVSPNNINKYLAANQSITRQLPSMFVGTGSSELTEAVGSIPKLVRKPFEHSQAAYDTFGTVARIEMAKAMLPTWKRTGQSMESLADYVNKATGIVSSKAMGVSPSQRAFESGLIFFAPRYIRASAALIADALAGGRTAEARESRKALASMLTAGLAAYIKAANAVGQEPVLDPADSRFLTIQVGNDRIGIGSVWTSMARLLARSVADPGGLAKVLPSEWDQNPFLTWMRSRFPPATATVADILSGKTYTGDELKDAASIAAYGASRFMPFALENRATPLVQKALGVESTGPGLGVAAEVAGFFGMRQFPQSYTERRESMTREYLKQQGRQYQKFNTLTAKEQQDITERMRSLGYPIKGDIAVKKNDLFTRHASNLESLANQVAQGVINKAQYREARKQAKLELSVLLEEIEREQNANKTPEQIEAAFQARLSSLSPQDAAREKYFKILFTKDALGQPNFDKAEEYLASLPVEYRDYIDETSKERLRNLPPAARQIEEEYRQARDILQPYWDVKNQVMRKRGVLDKYNNLTPAEQALFEKSRQWDIINKEITKTRERMRQRNKKIDAALVEWYGRVPMEGRGSPFALDLGLDFDTGFGTLDFSLDFGNTNNNPLRGLLD